MLTPNSRWLVHEFPHSVQVHASKLQHLPVLVLGLCFNPAFITEKKEALLTCSRVGKVTLRVGRLAGGTGLMPTNEPDFPSQQCMSTERKAWSKQHLLESFLHVIPVEAGGED